MDGDMHLHRDSEELYVQVHGELHLLVDGSFFTLKPGEVLMVKPQIPHAVVGGGGPIEHFVLRTPAVDDRQTMGKIPPEPPHAADEVRRELQGDWGCRVALTEARNQNCWLFGFGEARFNADKLCLAYMNFPTGESAKSTLGKSWKCRLESNMWFGIRLLPLRDSPSGFRG
jgi:hypothetical protein